MKKNQNTLCKLCKGFEVCQNFRKRENRSSAFYFCNCVLNSGSVAGHKQTSSPQASCSLAKGSLTPLTWHPLAPPCLPMLHSCQQRNVQTPCFPHFTGGKKFWQIFGFSPHVAVSDHLKNKILLLQRTAQLLFNEFVFRGWV